MKLLETKFEKGKYVTRLCGLRIWKRPEAQLSEQAALLRRELLTMADVGNMPPARGMARDVQLAGVVLLKEVLRVANENGFHPWTISGSLLIQSFRTMLKTVIGQKRRICRITSTSRK